MLFVGKAKLCFKDTYMGNKQTEVVLCERILVDGVKLNLQPQKFERKNERKERKLFFLW